MLTAVSRLFEYLPPSVCNTNSNLIRLRSVYSQATIRAQWHMTFIRFYEPLSQSNGIYVPVPVSRLLMVVLQTQGGSVWCNESYA